MTFSNLATRILAPGRFRVAMLTGFALVLTLATGCGKGSGAEADPGRAVSMPGQSTEGSIEIALLVPPSFQVATVNYQITKSGFSQAGSLNVSQSATIEGVIGAIPAGTGYTLALTMTDVAKKFTSCAGSSTFNVVAGTTTPVSVQIDCRLPQTTTVNPPAVPMPASAVALQAVALLAAGAFAAGRGRGRARAGTRRD